MYIISFIYNMYDICINIYVVKSDFVRYVKIAI